MRGYVRAIIKRCILPISLGRMHRFFRYVERVSDSALVFSVYPFALKHSAAGGIGILAVTVHFGIYPITLVGVAARPCVFSVALTSVIYPAALIHRTRYPGVCAVAVLFVVIEISCVYISV